MQKKISLKLRPTEASDNSSVTQSIAKAEGIQTADITGFNVIRQSIDARSKQVFVNLTLQVFINEPYLERPRQSFHFKDVHQSRRKVLVAGAGPAGLFAALKLIEEGIKPIIIERGKDVRARRRDLAILNKEGEVNPESNYCFGEGGAGTYSDGKLYTRSSKRGDVNRILNLFAYFGAAEKILYESHPHIGTNKLPGIITRMREKIIACGGEIMFEAKLVDLVISNNSVSAVKLSNGTVLAADAVILATGHSARDIFQLLHSKKLLIESKPFALGVRAEHPQSLIDRAQYHQLTREPFLPAASYSLVEQVDGKGVFSFCMCPGGIIAPAATSPGELVVNGWSPSRRDNPFANSGIVVTVEQKDLAALNLAEFEETCQQSPDSLNGPLAMMYFQQYVERKAFKAGGGRFVAPAQRLADFTDKKISDSLPDCSYLPGLKSAALDEVLPTFIYKRLRVAFREFGKKIRGYHTNEAVVVATESRTSSPVRIPRDKFTLEHPQVKNLYPCAEGAGYAGGIVSAAMDGESIASRIALVMKNGY